MAKKNATPATPVAAAVAAPVAVVLTREQEFALLVHEALLLKAERDRNVVYARDLAVSQFMTVNHHVAQSSRVSAAYTGSALKTLFFGVKIPK